MLSKQKHREICGIVVWIMAEHLKLKRNSKKIVKSIKKIYGSVRKTSENV